MREAILVRYGEITIKSKPVRRRMENTLLDNIKFMLERYGVEAELKLASGRIFIYTSNMKEALKALSFVFGIVSFSPAIEVGNEYSELVRTAVDYAKKFLEPGDRFAVRARRVKTLPYTSKDIEKDVGRSILEEVDGVSVDLEEPDKVIYVEARTNKAYIFTEVYVGPGGLPYGVEGKVVALISGGVDSALASYLMMRRGCEVVPVHFDMTPFYSIEARERFNRVIEWLRRYVPRREWRVYIVPLGEIHMKADDIEPSLRCIFCKTMMLKIAERIALNESAEAIVTGDSLGQVATQTLSNMVFLTKRVKVPILRPLVGLGKDDIVKMARRIGLAEVADVKVPPCKLIPQHPKTRAREEYEDIFSKYYSLVDYALSNSKVKVIS